MKKYQIHFSPHLNRLDEFQLFENLPRNVEASDSFAPIVCCRGWKEGLKWREQGKEVLVIERGFTPDRNNWTHVGWNGLNNRANFCLPELLDPQRFQSQFQLQPWSEGEKSYIVITGQVPGDSSLNGKDLTIWYEKLAKSLEKHHKLPVYFKHHPACYRQNRFFYPNLPVYQDSIETACKEARLIATWNSNSAVDAIIAGCPALTFDEGSMAWDVTSHDITKLIYPCRTSWAIRLSHCQWSKAELKAGLFWNRLLSHYDSRRP